MEWRDTGETAKGMGVLLTALFSWLIIGPLAAAAFMSAAKHFPPLLSALSGYIAVNIPHIMMFLSFVISLRLIMKTGIVKIITSGRHPLRISYALQIAAIYIVFMAADSLLSVQTISPGSASTAEKLIFIIPVLLITPVQALAEEILFRALPLRIAYGNRRPEKILEGLPIILMTGILFTLPHMRNPEVAASSSLLPLLYYFLWGSLAMFLALAADGFEAPSAMHMANNIFIAIAVNYEASPLPTASFFISGSVPSTLRSIAGSVIIFAVIYIFSLRRGEVLPQYSFRKRADTRYNS